PVHGTSRWSQGLHLQEAGRAVHDGWPWSRARLAQRTGRIDRLGSPHHTIATVTFLPPAPLADALAIEERLAAKVGAQNLAGTNGRLDWTDQLEALKGDAPGAPLGSWAAIPGPSASTVLIVRIANLVEAIVVAGGAARTSPAGATRILSDAIAARPVTVDPATLQEAI